MRRKIILLPIIIFTLCFAASFVYFQWIRTYSSVCTKCNVILISLDTLRGDSLPCYGYSRNTAPNLCAFAQSNTYFTNAYSNSPYTLSSHFSILTSLYPSHHHMVTAYKGTLNPSIVTLPQMLQLNGYDTIFVGPTDDTTLPLERGFERGFTHIVPNTTKQNEGWEKGLQTLAENAHSGKSTFLFLHTYAVHEPYVTSTSGSQWYSGTRYPHIPTNMDEFLAFTPDLLKITLDDLQVRLKSADQIRSRTKLQAMYDQLTQADTLKKAETVFRRFPIEEQWGYADIRYDKRIDRNNPEEVAYVRALYDQSIFQLDQQLAKLFSFLEKQRLWEKTIVVITADHGEEFMEHGKMFHNENIYNVETHVPLIIAAPNLPKKRSDVLTQGIDISPTILGFLAIAKPKQLEGIDLIHGTKDHIFARKNSYLISEYFGEGSIQSIRNNRMKLYVNKDRQGSAFELYDLHSDPAELHNIADEKHRTVRSLLQVLRQTIDKNLYSEITTRFPEWIDPEKQKKLIKEGYF